MTWTGWTLSRAVVLFAGLAYLMIFIQVAMFHSRQNYRNGVMWLPVAGGALTGLVAALAAVLSIRGLLSLVIVLFWLQVAGGLIGFAYHFRGVGQRVDGYKTRNFLVGPPVVMPLMYSAIGALGLLGAYWR